MTTVPQTSCGVLLRAILRGGSALSKEVAEYLGVCVRTVWSLRAEGNFAPGTKIGKKVV
jgi:hypothetical protein